MRFKSNEIIPEYLDVESVTGNLKQQVEIVKDSLHLYEGKINITLRSYLIYYSILLISLITVIFNFYCMINAENILGYTWFLILTIWMIIFVLLIVFTEFKYNYFEYEIYLKRKED